MKEEEIVARFFSHLGGEGAAAPGDDCALLSVSEGERLVVSMDTSVVGRHFPADTPVPDIGWRCLAVALSDLAACGARADFCLLSLTIPQAEEKWLQGFATGFGECALNCGVSLVGGDLVRGELSISVQVGGWVAQQDFLSRSGGAVGDGVYVTGTLGAAARGRELMQSGGAEMAENADCLRAFLRPLPRLEAGERLTGLASACIDISDGLAADLSRLCRASGLGAQLQSKDIPVCPGGTKTAAMDRALHGGDDYQLCFTVSPQQAGRLSERLGAEGKDWWQVGVLTKAAGLRLDGEPLRATGWEHFS